MSSNSNGTPKWILYAGGFASIATIIGVMIAYGAFVRPPAQISSPGVTINTGGGGNQPSGNNALASATPTPIPTSAPIPTSTPIPTPSPTWNVILDRTYNALTFRNYTVSDTQGHHFLIVDASFANISSVAQSLAGGLFDLQDGSGQHYTEDQASNPGQTFVVNPGQSIETTTSFVVPNTACKFQLSFSAGSSNVTQWTINSSMCP